MDPASAIGVTSAVITFLEFSWKVVRNAKEIYDSADGSLSENLTRESIARSMQSLSRKLQPPDLSAIPPEYQGICKLSRECQSISHEIIKISESIKIGGDRSRYNALRTGLKTWRFKKDLLQLEERLSRCGDQLSLELSYLKSEQITCSLEQILFLAQEDSFKLQKLQQTVDELRQATQVNLGSDILAHVRNIIQRHDAALDGLCRDRILRSLCSSQMDPRYDQVHLPADGTFEWVLDPGRVEESHFSDVEWEYQQLQMQSEASEKFVKWLSFSNGIFHISGKLGSGKSTLMKLLYTHSRTRKELRVWSGGKKLLTATFFFWKHGTNSQNSLNGLYRSLLHSILTECPELIPSTLPSYWGQVKKDTSFIQSQLRISAEIIERSLFMLLKNESFYESRRLCIFVDGLDEFVGDGQHDYRTLVDLLDTWVEGSRDNLKLCVSSREENVFMNRYQEYQRLRLHEMTWYDLRKYTQARLSHLQDKALLEKLCFEVANKAQGIFLWCTLVVQTLRREIEVDPHNSLAGSPMRQSSIMRLLDELPADLEEIFRYTLNRLSRQEKRSLYQTLLMVKVSAETPSDRPIRLWLVAYSYLDDYNKDPGFALDRKSERGPVNNMISLEERMVYARRKLQHESGGLLEGVIDRSDEADEWDLSYNTCYDSPTFIDFAHRSVPEILQVREFASEMEDILGSFDAADALANLSLEYWRLWGASTGRNGNLFVDLAALILKRPFEKTNFEFLDTLDFAYEDLTPKRRSSQREVSIVMKADIGETIGCVSPNDHEKEDEGAHHIIFNTSFLAMALKRYDYVLWKIKHRAAIMDSPIYKGVLATLFFEMPLAEHDDRHLQDEIFNVGCFPSSCATGFTKFYRRNRNFNLRNVECMTIWREFLAANWLAWSKNPHRSQRKFGHWLGMFLKSGAPCEFQLIITRSSEEECATLTLGEVEVKIRAEYRTDLSGKRQTLEALRAFESDTVYTLADWIQTVNLPNLDQILCLLEENNTVLRRHYPDEESLHDLKTVTEAPSVRTRMQELTNLTSIAFAGLLVGLAFHLLFLRS